MRMRMRMQVQVQMNNNDKWHKTIKVLRHVMWMDGWRNIENAKGEGWITRVEYGCGEGQKSGRNVLSWMDSHEDTVSVSEFFFFLRMVATS